MRMGWLSLTGAFVVAVFGTAQWSRANPPASERSAEQMIDATLRTQRAIVQAGRPIRVEFCLSNLTETTITLRAPDASGSEPAPDAMGLPLGHVFSGIQQTALAIQDEHGEIVDAQMHAPPQAPGPDVHMAPHSSIGITVELTQYYECLRRPGTYTLRWLPYNATLESPPLKIEVLPERQAVILTEVGEITIRFYYEEAPRHVQNFIELIDQKFYDNLTFNRIIPGGLIQGGDPRGDRRGIRTDGKRLKAEFSTIPFDRGTVGMARSPNDPDSASCQFFICLGRQPSFDGTQTAFGYVVGEKSFETLRRIAAVPTEADDRPREAVYIRAIRLENVLERQPKFEDTANPVTGGPATQPAGALPKDDAAAKPPATQPAVAVDK